MKGTVFEGRNRRLDFNYYKCTDGVGLMSVYDPKFPL
jgi:hypothetical protein